MKIVHLSSLQLVSAARFSWSGAVLKNANGETVVLTNYKINGTVKIMSWKVLGIMMYVYYADCMQEKRFLNHSKTNRTVESWLYKLYIVSVYLGKKRVPIFLKTSCDKTI